MYTREKLLFDIISVETRETIPKVTIDGPKNISVPVRGAAHFECNLPNTTDGVRWYHCVNETCLPTDTNASNSRAAFGYLLNVSDGA